MNDQKIYQRIGEFLRSIMLENVLEIYYIGCIYPDYSAGGAEWLTKENKIVSFEMGQRPYHIESQIDDLIVELRLLDIFKEKWTHFKITLTDNGVLMIAPMSIKNPSAATKNILSNQPFNKSDIVVPKNEINIENINNGINSGKNVYVTLKVDGNLFFDTNQSLRPITKSDLNSPTLISDRINKKLENNPNKLLPNANMASAHGEIGAMQQLVNVGKAKNANIIIDVKGKDVCGFCRGDIAAMAEKSGANSVLIHANRDKTGAPVTYYWKPGMKSVKEVKK